MQEKTEYSAQQYVADPFAKIRDMEEKQRLVKDRILLLAQTQIEEREKTFSDLQELKKTVLVLKEENIRIKELFQRITEQINNAARKEELAILQRQFDLFRK